MVGGIYGFELVEVGRSFILYFLFVGFLVNVLVSSFSVFVWRVRIVGFFVVVIFVRSL